MLPLHSSAANDLERATAMSRQMITRFGMSETRGPRVFGTDPQPPFLGRPLGAARTRAQATAEPGTGSVTASLRRGRARPT